MTPTTGRTDTGLLAIEAVEDRGSARFLIDDGLAYQNTSSNADKPRG